MILNAMQGSLAVYATARTCVTGVRDRPLFAIRAVLAKGSPGEVYNIGGNCERANIDVVRAVCGTGRIRAGFRHRRMSGSSAS